MPTLAASADAQQDIPRRFAPTDIFTLQIDKVQVQVPYAYLREFWLVKLKKNTVVRVEDDGQSAIYFQYLFPSLAPPPEKCKHSELDCAGMPVKGFKAAPKGEKQFYVFYSVSKLNEAMPTDKDFAQFLRGPTANHVIYGDKFTENKQLGLIQSKPFLDFERYIPTQKLTHPTKMLCTNDDCSIWQYDKKNNLVHYLLLHKDHLPKWKEIIASRQAIFERYLKK